MPPNAFRATMKPYSLQLAQKPHLIKSCIRKRSLHTSKRTFPCFSFFLLDFLFFPFLVPMIISHSLFGLFQEMHQFTTTLTLAGLTGDSDINVFENMLSSVNPRNNKTKTKMN